MAMERQSLSSQIGIARAWISISQNESGEGGIWVVDNIVVIITS